MIPGLNKNPMEGIPGMTSEKMGAHAQHLWSFLDDLHQNDPEGYAAFLEKQKKVIKESLLSLSLSLSRSSLYLSLSIYGIMTRELYVKYHLIYLMSCEMCVNACVCVCKCMCVYVCVCVL